MRIMRNIAAYCMLWSIAGAISGCNSETASYQRIRYGSGPVFPEIPVHFSQETGLYKAEGIDLEMTLFPDGKSAFEALLYGQADIASVMSTPVARQAFQEGGFRIIGAVNHGKFHKAIAKESVLEKDSLLDLSKHRIGVTRYTSGEYFMHSYFALHEIPWNGTNVIYGSGPQLQQHFLEDSIDIMFSWEPYIRTTKETYPDTVLELGETHLAPSSWLIVCDSLFFEENKTLVHNFLKVTHRGLERIRRQKKIAIQLHKLTTSRSGFPVHPIPEDAINGLDLYLDEGVILDLEEQADWLTNMNYVDRKEVPDFEELICMSPLQAVDSLKVYLPIYRSCR